MATFFTPFEKVGYDMNKSGMTFQATNIMKRFQIKEVVRQIGYIYHDYDIKEGDRPDIVSYKAYGKVDLEWLIMLTNSIIDPYFQWPLTYNQLQAYMIKKYGSIPIASQTVHHYERIIQDAETLSDGTVIPQKTVIIDADAYALLDGPERILVYKYDHEIALNEKRARIKILDPSYVPQIVKEIESIFS